MESDHINRHAKNRLFQCRTSNRIKQESFRSLQLLFVELHWGIWQKISTAKDHCKLFSQALRAAFKAICFAPTSTEMPQTPQTNGSIMFRPIITDSLPESFPFGCPNWSTESAHAIDDNLKLPLLCCMEVPQDVCRPGPVRWLFAGTEAGRVALGFGDGKTELWWTNMNYSTYSNYLRLLMLVHAKSSAANWLISSGTWQ